MPSLRYAKGYIGCLLMLSAFGEAQARVGQAPLEAPKIRLDLDWTPAIPDREHPLQPEVAEALKKIRDGGTEDFEAVVRKAYSMVSAYAQNEGHTIVFELSDLKTTYMPELLHLRFGDVTSHDVRERIAITGITAENTRDGKTVSVRRGYSVKWEAKSPIPDAEVWRNRPMSEVVEISRKMYSYWERLRAVTSFRVTVSFEGKQLQYGAAFAWIADPSGDITIIEGWEPVTDRVILALAESLSPDARGVSEGKGEGRRYIEAAGIGTCDVRTTYPTTPVWRWRGTDGHSSGAHVSESAVNISCHCASTCESICHPSLYYLGCEDTGVTPTGFHVKGTDFKPQNGSVQNAFGIASSCLATTGCAMRLCPDPSCTFGIQVTPGGPTISSNPPGSAFWQHAPTTTASCHFCEQREADPIPDPEFPDDGCPILIALDDNERRLELTNLAQGVRFDLNRDGAPERLSWTTANSLWAFLGMDRNRDGRIDNGGELFGNHTMQPVENKIPHGYHALAEYDKAAYGGNGDAVIDDSDQVFQDLLLWRDANHDGVSQAAELTPLGTRVEAIELDYHESRARDKHGNQFRYRSTVWLSNGRKSRAIDVFFLTD